MTGTAASMPVPALPEVPPTRLQRAFGRDSDVEAASQRLEPEIREHYADWVNPIWIPFALESFHRDLDG